jgi:hypothetical protein
LVEIVQRAIRREGRAAKIILQGLPCRGSCVDLHYRVGRPRVAPTRALARLVRPPVAVPVPQSVAAGYTSNMYCRGTNPGSAISIEPEFHVLTEVTRILDVRERRKNLSLVHEASKRR